MGLNENCNFSLDHSERMQEEVPEKMAADDTGKVLDISGGDPSRPAGRRPKESDVNYKRSCLRQLDCIEEEGEGQINGQNRPERSC